MLDGLFDALMPARAGGDKIPAAGDADAVEAFAGLMDLVSLPELPLQAYLAEAAPVSEGETPEPLDLPAQVLSDEAEDAPIPMWLLAQVGAAMIPPEAETGEATVTDADELPAEAIAAAIVSPGPAAKTAEPHAALDLAPEVSSATGEKNAAATKLDLKHEVPAVPLPTGEAAPGDTVDLAQNADDLLRQGAALASKEAERSVLAPAATNSATGVAPVAHVSPLQATVPPSAVPQAHAPQVPHQVPVENLAQHTLATIRHQGHDQAEVRISLHPAELGALDLQIEQDGKRLELNITVDNESARRAVGEQMMSLRERLGDAGLQLARLDVSVRDQSQRQNPDTPSESIRSAPDGDVKNTTQLRIASPANGLDLYA